MSDIVERLEKARAELAALEREARMAKCADVGHRWHHVGGANCGCEDGQCSVPVHECDACEISDYGDNEEATDIRAACAQDREEREGPKMSATGWLSTDEYKGITILDPDGWDRRNGQFERSWSELITKDEFEKRLSISTVQRK